jgi:biotin operon repressor
MAGDWVKTYRKMLASEVFLDSDPYLLKLWIYCLLKANWKPKPFSGVMIPIGSFAFVSRNLAGVLGVSRGKLWRDINKLETMSQIETQTNRNFTVVSICNWETYQDIEDDDRDTDEPQTETKTGRKRTTGGTTNGTTNKEVKKGRSKEVKETTASQSVPIPENLNQPDFVSALEDFRQMRREIKKPFTPAAEKKLFAKLAKWGTEKAIVALDKSTENSWQGVFEPKPEDMPATVVSRVPTDADLAEWSPD